MSAMLAYQAEHMKNPEGLNLKTVMKSLEVELEGWHSRGVDKSTYTNISISTCTNIAYTITNITEIQA